MGVALAFTLDYAQYCKKRGHVLAGVKIVDRNAINPNDGTIMMTDGKNIQENEEITCIPLHFVNSKDSHTLFVIDLKPFLDFGKRCKDVGLVSRKPGEPALFPFKWCAFPTEISAEYKYLNVGEGAKLRSYFHKIYLMYIIVVLFMG